MMEYERLTERAMNGVAGTKGCSTCVSFTDCCDCPYVESAFNRLAELEDKIEQGTLIDTEAYFIVEENQWAGKNRFLVCQNAVQLAVCDFCETREEAEKRLKESQE
jgi:hypothetical protein